MKLRPATPDDTSAIATVWYDAWRDGHLEHVPEALLAHRQPAHFHARVPPRIAQTTVAVLDGAIVGFTTLHDDEVEQVFVAAAARGHGIADALLAHAERRLAMRHDVAWLAVASGNARARRFYEKCGWRDVGAFAYAAEIEGGTIAVPCQRYEKHLRRN